jgi:flagellar basal-body rod protein FlgF
MDDLMATARVLMAQETRRVEASAHNIANASTPGFKSEIAFQELLPDIGLGGTEPSVPIRMATDFRAGKLVHTGNPYDLAIEGDGFFAVGTPAGTAYTRAGAFHRDDSGRLVTAQGWPVRSDGGGDITLDGGAWHVEADGTVVDDGNPVATLGIFTAADPSAMQRTPDGLFTGAANAASPDTTSHVRQGFVESSNVAVGDDMVRVMGAMRRVESGQKLVQAYDDMIGNVLQHMGDM